MNSFLLQDWVGLGTNGSVTANITQPSAMWLDLGAATELTFLLEVAGKTGGGVPKVWYETAPLRDAGMFRTLATVNLVENTTNVQRISLYANPSQPLMRYVRWRVTNDVVAWTATFRLTVMTYPR